jgi:hypothetical protein
VSEGALLLADGVGARVPLRARAQVHSAFPGACNLETDCGELVTLLAAGAGNAPHGIRCTAPLAALSRRLRQGQAASLDGATLRIPAAHLRVDFSRAAVWSGRVAAASPGLSDTELQRTLRRHAPDQGAAPALFFSGRPVSALQCALAARMTQTLPKLAHATAKRDVRAVVAALSALLGLGPGLTPAGDDFIVGYLAALWSRSPREPGIAALLRALAAPVSRMSLLTNAISRQMLLDALHGHFAERLTDVVRCICEGGDVAGASMRALEIGHSSGADALCGLLFGYSLMPAESVMREDRACRPH